MKILPRTIERLQAILQFAIDRSGEPFTAAEIIEMFSISNSHASDQLRHLVDLGCLKRKRSEDCYQLMVYTLGTVLELPYSCEGDPVKQELTKEEEMTQKVVVKKAEQCGVERPWYLSCLFGAGPARTA